MRQLKGLLGPAVLLTAVVKGDAYGHGAVVGRPLRAGCRGGPAGGGLAAGGPADCAALAWMDPLLILGPTPPWEAERLVAQGIMATVMSLPTAQALSAAAVTAGVTATVHIKVDTGMGRYGLLPDEVLPFALALRDLPGLNVEGLWTHFATAEDGDATYLHQQLGVFLAVAGSSGRAELRCRCGTPPTRRRRSATPSRAWRWCAAAWPSMVCTRRVMPAVLDAAAGHEPEEPREPPALAARGQHA